MVQFQKGLFLDVIQKMSKIVLQDPSVGKLAITCHCLLGSRYNGKTSQLTHTEKIDHDDNSIILELPLVLCFYNGQ